MFPGSYGWNSLHIFQVSPCLASWFWRLLLLLASLDPVAFLAQDRIDQTTLNAALFFTVKPSELRLLSVLGSGGYANVYKAVRQCRFSVLFGPKTRVFHRGKARQMAVWADEENLDGWCLTGITSMMGIGLFFCSHFWPQNGRTFRAAGGMEDGFTKELFRLDYCSRSLDSIISPIRIHWNCLMSIPPRTPDHFLDYLGYLILFGLFLGSHIVTQYTSPWSTRSEGDTFDSPTISHQRWSPWQNICKTKRHIGH